MSAEPSDPEDVAAPPPDSLQRLSPRVRIVWVGTRLGLWLVAAVALTIARGIGFFSAPWWQVWVFSPSIAWLIPPIHILLPLVSYRGWGYRLREHDLLVRHGVLTREYVAVPLARVQQVDATSGVVERLLGLTTLVVHTAGTRAARTQLPGLPSEDAEALRDHLSRKGDELAE